MKLLFLAVILSTAAFAGKEGGNGGGSHFCPGRSFQEMYDVYEARTRYDFTLIGDGKPVDFYLKRALWKIQNSTPALVPELKVKLSFLMNEGHFLRRVGIKLTPVHDANILVVQKGCRYAQVANWDDVSDNVMVSAEIFDRFSNLNKAALYLHEALYKIYRESDGDYNEVDDDGKPTGQNSDTVRRLVGDALSANDRLKYSDDWKNLSLVGATVSPVKMAAGIRMTVGVGTRDFSSETWNQVKLTYHLGDRDYASFKNLSMVISLSSEAEAKMSEKMGSLEQKIKALEAQRVAEYAKPKSDKKLLLSLYKEIDNLTAEWHSLRAGMVVADSNLSRDTTLVLRDVEGITFIINSTGEAVSVQLHVKILADGKEIDSAVYPLNLVPGTNAFSFTDLSQNPVDFHY